MIPVLLLAVVLSASADRKFMQYFNPDCSLSPDKCNHFGQPSDYWNNLQYVVSRDASNTNATSYRVFWSTIGAPTIILTETPGNVPDTIPELDFASLIQDDHMENPVLQLWGDRFVAVTLSKLIEFEDRNDTAQISDSGNVTVRHLANAEWNQILLNETSDGDLLATFDGVLDQYTLRLEMRAHKNSQRAAAPPRLLVEPSSVSLRIVLDNQTVQWEKSRFAIEVLFASNDASSRVAYSESKAISDEYSPGVFTVEQISGADTYMEWKPIVYTKVDPGVSDSTRSRTGPLLNVSNSFSDIFNGTFPYSLLQALKGLDGEDISLRSFNLTLGIPGDDFYGSSSYQEWSCELGLGQPTLDGTSSKVKLIIAIGFGVPAGLIVIGAVYVIHLRLKRRREASKLIQDPATSYSTLG